MPALKDTSIIRMWAALWVMAPDGFPIYQQSARFPGAFAATCHSGVTLAGELPEALAAFTARRFRPSQAA
ncbi:MAG TPA: hypothetical protein PLD10_11715 [Rhodopila sp.]|nr:hypothetical protein [Rhodopila sp.]